MSITVRGYAQFYPLGQTSFPLQYRTDKFTITNKDSIDELYSYFSNNGAISWMRRNYKQDNWGDPLIGYVQGYTVLDKEWTPTELPDYPISLIWRFVEVDDSGSENNTIATITTPLNDTRRYN